MSNKNKERNATIITLEKSIKELELALDGLAPDLMEAKDEVDNASTDLKGFLDEHGQRQHFSTDEKTQYTVLATVAKKFREALKSLRAQSRVLNTKKAKATTDLKQLNHDISRENKAERDRVKKAKTEEQEATRIAKLSSDQTEKEAKELAQTKAEELAKEYEVKAHQPSIFDNTNAKSMVEDNSDTGIHGVTFLSVQQKESILEPKTNAEFMTNIFGDHVASTTVAVWNTGEDRKVGFNTRQFLTAKELMDKGSAGRYFSGSTFTGTSRKKEDFHAMFVLMIDDIGEHKEAKTDSNGKVTRAAYTAKGIRDKLKPTYSIETSPGSFQDGYVLALPINSVDFATSIVKRAGIVGDVSGNNIIRWMRLPIGINVKPDRKNEDGSFWENKVEWHGKTVTIQELDEALPKLPNKQVSVRAKGEMSLNEMDEVRFALSYISPNGYDEWLSVGFILNNHSNASAQGLEIWDTWSSDGDDYEADACDQKWESMREGTSGKKLTIKSLFHKAGDEYLAAVSKNTRKGLVARIAVATDEEQLEKIQVEVSRNSQRKLCKKDRAQVGDSMLEAYNRLRITISKATITQCIQALKDEDPHLLSESEAPAWAQNRVYIGTEDKVYNSKTKTSIAPKPFNTMNIEAAADDTKNSEHAMALDCGIAAGWIPTVFGKGYKPGAPEVYRDVSQELTLNMYIPPLLRVPSGESRKAVERFVKHVQFLVKGSRGAQLTLDYLAWPYQNPNNPKPFALVLTGPEGNGKTLMAEIAGQALGQGAFGLIEPRLFEKEWTEWAEGNMIKVVEEVKLQGKERYNAINSVKPFISNKSFVINKRNVGTSIVNRTAAWVLFSNYADALPVTEDMRRYLLTRSAHETTEEVRESLGGADAYNEYFAEIATIRENYLPEIAYFFTHEYVINDEFSKANTAPKTKELADMANAAADGSEEGIMRERIEDFACEIVNAQVVDLTYLKLKADLPNSEHKWPHGRVIAATMQTLGYRKVKKMRLKSERTTTPHTWYVNIRTPDESVDSVMTSAKVSFLEAHPSYDLHNLETRAIQYVAKDLVTRNIEVVNFDDMKISAVKKTTILAVLPPSITKNTITKNTITKGIVVRQSKDAASNLKTLFGKMIESEAKAH